DVAVNEHPLPRYRHVVEDRERVLLVIVRSERAVEVAAAGVVGLAADELEPWRAAWDREAERVILLARAARIKRADPQFVGERRQRREHLAPAHDYAVGGLAHH